MNCYQILVLLALSVVPSIRWAAEVGRSLPSDTCGEDYRSVSTSEFDSAHLMRSLPSQTEKERAFKEARLALTEYFARGKQADVPALDALFKKIAEGDERALEQLQPGSMERRLLDDIVRQSEIVERLLADQRLKNPDGTTSLPAFLKSKPDPIWKRAIQFMRRPLRKLITAENFSEAVKRVAPEKRLKEFKASVSAFPLITHEEAAKILSAFPPRDQAPIYAILAPKIVTKGAWHPVKDLVELVRDLEPGVAGKIIRDSGYERMSLDEVVGMLSAFPIRAQGTVYRAVQPRPSPATALAPSHLLALTQKIDPPVAAALIDGYGSVPADRVAELAATSPTELSKLLVSAGGIPYFKPQFSVESLLPKIRQDRRYSLETVRDLAAISERAGLAQRKPESDRLTARVMLIDYLLSKELVEDSDQQKVRDLKLDDLRLSRQKRPITQPTKLSEPVDTVIRRVVALKPKNVEKTPMTTKQVDALNLELARYVGKNAGALSFADLQRLHEASVHYTLNVVDPIVTSKTPMKRGYSDDIVNQYIDYHFPKMTPDRMIEAIGMVHVVERPQAAANYLLFHPEISVDSFKRILSVGWFANGRWPRKPPKEVETLVRHYVRQNLGRLTTDERQRLAEDLAEGPLRHFILTAGAGDGW